MEEINYTFILLSALAVIASPGPATLAIAATSMNYGRYNGVSLALGVVCGSFIWSVTAALGLATLVNGNIWILDIMKYCGAAYLLFLAYKSIRSIIYPTKLVMDQGCTLSFKQFYFKGLMIHITNPKAILFFSSIYSIGIPKGSDITDLLTVIISIGMISVTVFIGYAILFSNRLSRIIYFKLKNYFEAIFFVLFGIAGTGVIIEGINKY